ncbi:MAG: T9SS type A sorting domain-containing protein [Bacteroidota bacterium]
MKSLKLFFLSVFLSFLLSNFLLAQSCTLNYIIDGSDQICNGDGQLCLLTNPDISGPFDHCANYAFELEYPTGAYIYTDLGDFSLFEFDSSSTRLRTVAIFPLNSSGYTSFCLTLIQQAPNAVPITIRVVNLNDPNDILSSESYLADEVREIDGLTNGPVLLSDLYDEPNDVLLDSADAAIQGQRVKISGTLIINDSYVFGTSGGFGSGAYTNSIAMLPGARIEFAPNASHNLDFIDATIGGCGSNWDQIHVSDGQHKIGFLRSTISDADVGVNLQDGASIFMLETLLEDNVIGIGSLGPSPKNIAIEDLLNFSNLRLNTIRNCDKGVSLENINGDVVTIENITFTDNNIGVQLNNVFQFLMDGPLIANSSLYGIRGIGKNNIVTIQNTLHVNNRVGVEFRSYDQLNFYDNEINGGQTGYQQYFSEPGGYAEFLRNTFRGRNGIVGLVAPSRADIRENVFNNENLNVGLIGVGNGSHFWAVQHNTSMSSSGQNVALYNMDDARIFRNLNMSSTGAQSVLVQGGSDINMGYNILTGGQEGLRIDNSTSNRIYCNDISGAAIGLQVLNNCRNADILGNLLGGNTINLRYGTPDNPMAFSSDQYQAGNCFDLSSPGNPVAIHLGTAAEAEQSLYNVPTFYTQGDTKYPYFLSAFPQWFDAPGGPLNEYTCPNGTPPPAPPGDEEACILGKGVDLMATLKPDLTTSYGHDVGKNIDVELLQDAVKIVSLPPCSTGPPSVLPQLLQHPGLVNAKKFGEWRRDARTNLSALWVGDALYQQKQQEMKGLVGQFQATQPYVWDDNTQTIIFDPAEASQRASIQQVMDQVESDVTQQKNLFLQSWVPGVQILKTEILTLSTGGNLSLEVLKEVKAIEADYFLGTPLSNSQITQLENLADLCPAEAGDGVYVARALLIANSGEFEWNYDDECVDSGIQINALMSTENEVFAPTVYPNPAQQLLQVKWPEQDSFTELQVVNVNGQVLMSQKLDLQQQSQELQISNLSTGTYLVRLVGENRSKTVHFIKQ